MGWAWGMWETWPGATDPLQITIWRQERPQQNNSRTAGGALSWARLKLTGRGDKSFMCFLLSVHRGQLTLIVERGEGLTAAGLNRNWILDSYHSVFIRGAFQLMKVSWCRCCISWIVTLTFAAMCMNTNKQTVLLWFPHRLTQLSERCQLSPLLLNQHCEILQLLTAS